MIERIVLIVVLMAAGLAAYWLLTRGQVRRAANAAATDPLLSGIEPGKPAIIYFTTPTCAPCRLQQTPNLQRLQHEIGAERLHIIRVDATQDPDAADRWGVFSVPTTFVLNAHGQPRSVYNGIVDVATLKREIEI